jgi:chromosome segregation ATPase
MLAKKEQQGTKIQELYHKLATVQQNRETTERTCYVIRDDVRELEGKMDSLSLEVKDFEGAVQMQAACMEKLSAARVSDPEGSKKEKKMTETQRAMLEAKIMQCQQATLDLSSKLSNEKRDRDSDFDQVTIGYTI